MFHNCNWLGANRANDEYKSELFIKLPCLFKIRYSYPYVIDPDDFFHLDNLSNE